MAPSPNAAVWPGRRISIGLPSIAQLGKAAACLGVSFGSGSGHRPRGRLRGTCARAGLSRGAGRNDDVEHLAPAAQVIVGHPARQAKQAVIQQRLVIENAEELLDLTFRRGLGNVDAETDGGPVAPAERRQHAFADGDLVAQVLGTA